MPAGRVGTCRLGCRDLVNNFYNFDNCHLFLILILMSYISGQFLRSRWWNSGNLHGAHLHSCRRPQDPRDHGEKILLRSTQNQFKLEVSYIKTIQVSSCIINISIITRNHHPFIRNEFSLFLRGFYANWAPNNWAPDNWVSDSWATFQGRTAWP